MKTMFLGVVLMGDVTICKISVVDASGAYVDGAWGQASEIVDWLRSHSYPPCDGL